MKKIIFIFVLIYSINLEAQENISKWHIGLRFDINMVKEQTMLGIEDQPTIVERNHIYHSYVLSPVSFYFPVNYICAENVQLELRPGLLMRGSELSSYTLGLLSKYYIIPNLMFVSLGLENSLHMAGVDVGSSHTSIPHWTRVTGYNDDKIHTALILGAGINTSKKVSFDFSFTKPFSEVYGYYKVVDEKNHFELPDGKYSMKLYWMLRLGVNIFIFDL